MTVNELIETLKRLPPDLQVVRPLHSEWCLIRADEIVLRELGAPRSDEWVPDLRPGKDARKYVVIGGW